MNNLTAGVEIGGTKTVVVFARGRELVALHRIPTTTPGETLAACSATLSGWADEFGMPTALGIGSFGPLDLRGGRITNTPKPGWAGTDVIGHFEALRLPVAFDTDVNAAALAEHLWGAAANTSVSLYMTIGTGIGAGVIVDGRPLHGLVHPEVGHVMVNSSDGFAGTCPFHGNCVEGLASGPAIAARTGENADTLADSHPVWPHVAAEIADVLAATLLILSPERIVLGGGVGLGRPHLLPLIREHVVRQLGGYVAGVTSETIGALIQPALLGSLSGPLGAAALPSASLRPAPVRGDLPLR